MQEFLAWLSRVLDSWKCWIVIAPWEIGVRVRLGKHATAMMPGAHFRIPFVDMITLVNTRLRIDGTPPVTVGGSIGGRTRYISATVGYRVSDPLRAMLKFGLPNAVVISKAQGEIAASRDESKALESLKEYFNGESGVAIDFVKFVEDVEVKTYRFLNAISYPVAGHEGSSGPGVVSNRY